MLNDRSVQLVRSLMQSVWTAVVAFAGVADVLDALGLNAEWALRVAIPLSMGIVMLAAQHLPKVHPVFGLIISLINKAPAYIEADPAER